MDNFILGPQDSLNFIRGIMHEPSENITIARLGTFSFNEGVCGTMLFKGFGSSVCICDSHLLFIKNKSTDSKE